MNPRQWIERSEKNCSAKINNIENSLTNPFAITDQVASVCLIEKI